MFNICSKKAPSRDRTRVTAGALRTGDLLDVAEKGGTSQGPIVGRLVRLEADVGDVRKVGALWLLVYRTFVHL